MTIDDLARNIIQVDIAPADKFDGRLLAETILQTLEADVAFVVQSTPEGRRRHPENPGCDAIIKTHLAGNDFQPLAA
jgi:hypothetical protein